MTRTRPRKKLSSRAVSAELAAISSNIAALAGSLRRNLAAFEREEDREEAHQRVRMTKAIRGPRRSKLPLCGARCRDGHPCRRKCLPWRPRCSMHGGLSTGPRTAGGKAKLAASMRERWAAWRRGEGPKPGRQGTDKAAAGAAATSLLGQGARGRRVQGRRG